MPLSPTTLYTEEAHEIICEAYTYGYPLVLTDVIRQLMTSAGKGGVHRSPLNQFVHARAISENVAFGHFGADADMLHSIAWLNVAKEPTVLSVPDVHQRHYTMHLVDGWMIAFAALGARTTGNRKGHFAIVGPRWSGDIPTGIRVLASPTAIVWLIGRTQTHGAKDYSSVHEIQNQHGLTPLSLWGHTEAPEQPAPAMRDVALKATPSEQVARMDASTFFGRLNTLMSDNLPRTADAPALKRFSAVGVGPGRPFELRDDPVLARSVDGSVRTALARIVVEATKPSGRTPNGWEIQPNNVGVNETDYMWRAVVAFLNPGARPVEDGLSLHTSVDAEGVRLTGTHRYVLRFAKGHTPPVNGFWSVAVHNSRRAFVQNEIDRHAISSTDPLKPHADGSVTLHIQHERPDKHSTSTWLPTPKDQFTLTMQLHWPQAEIVDRTWTPPSVERIS